MDSAPKNVQVRPLSSSTMVITWEPPETPNGQVTVSCFHFNNNFFEEEISDFFSCCFFLLNRVIKFTIQRIPINRKHLGIHKWLTIVS